MGFKFRRSVRLMPSVRLNFSSSGVSTSLGLRGATVNIGKRGVRGTVGVPGTGLSYSTMLSSKRSSLPQGDSEAAYAVGQVIGRGLRYAIVGGLGLLAVTVLILFSLPSSTTPGASSAAVPAVRHVTAAVVNCRNSSSKRGAVVAKLSSTDALSVGAEEAGWTLVTVNERSCWVSSALLAHL